jgi:hypothetical protein
VILRDSLNTSIYSIHSHLYNRINTKHHTETNNHTTNKTSFWMVRTSLVRLFAQAAQAAATDASGAAAAAAASRLGSNSAAAAAGGGPRARKAAIQLTDAAAERIRELLEVRHKVSAVLYRVCGLAVNAGGAVWCRGGKASDACTLLLHDAL